MEAVKYILEKYGLNPEDKMPLVIDKSRWTDMAKLFKELGYKVGAEIGVLKGQFTKNLASEGLKVYGIDPWIKYKTYNDFRSQEKLNLYESEARDRCKDLDVEFIKKWSMDAVEDFEDESLDFVFIDGNHALEYVIEDIAKWSKKVRKGGIVAGHDYFRPKHSNNLMHAKDAVNTWVYCYKIKPFFIFKKSKCPAWFWVKE